MGAICNATANNEYEYEANLITLQDERYTYVHKRNVFNIT
jgi:hypothetical protein